MPKGRPCLRLDVLTHAGDAAPRTTAGLVAVLSTGTGEYSSTLIDVSRTGIRVSGPELPRRVSTWLFAQRTCALSVRSSGRKAMLAR